MSQCSLLVEEKLCSKCGETLPLEEFHANRTRKDGKSYWCKTCGSKASKKYHREHREEGLAYNREYRQEHREECSAYNKKYRQAHREEARAKLLKGKFGISVGDYDSLLASQDSVCAICGETNPGGERLAVDHNHKTGEVRGLLCCKCNLLLGNAKDNPDILRSAAIYLTVRTTVSRRRRKGG